MDKKHTARATSSPVASDSFTAAANKDSFLEDMQLYSRNANVTRRTLSPTILPFATVMEAQDVVYEKNNSQNSTSVKMSTASATTSKSDRRSVGSNDRSSSGGNGDNNSWRQSYLKTEQNAEVSIETREDSQRRLNGEKKLEVKNSPDSVALLSDIEKIVSTHTKEWGIRLWEHMNELHLLGEVSLLKNFMFSTDEIRKDLQLGENLGTLKVLMAENDKHKETCSLLNSLVKTKIENEQRLLEEIERIKDENASLKLRIQELTARKSG